MKTQKHTGQRHRRLTKTATPNGPAELVPTDAASLLALARIGKAPGQATPAADARTGSALFPEFRGALQWVAPQRFFCPTLCGCVVSYQYTFYFSEALLSRVDPLRLEWMADQHQFNRVTPATATTILRQCADHKHLVGAKALFAEVWHLHGNRHGYDCGCTVSIWFDDRVPSAERVHTPVEHDVHTNRCAKHARLDTVKHYETLMGLKPKRPALVVQAVAWDWRQSIDAAIAGRAPMVPSLVMACG